MLTKLGAELAGIETSHSALVYPNVLEGAMIGATRANELSNREYDALINHYGLPENANLELRNGIRGIVGSTLGSIPGIITHALAGPKHKRLSVLSEIAAPLGGFLGAQLMTDKYSSKNARNILGV